MSINEEWFSDGAFETFKLPAREKFVLTTEAGTIKTLEGETYYEPGHYLMTGPKGEQYTVSPTKFHQLKDDNGDGTASPKKIVKLAKLADHSGMVKTSWADMNYNPGCDYIVRHGPGDYSVIKTEVFDITYEKSNIIKE